MSLQLRSAFIHQLLLSNLSSYRSIAWTARRRISIKHTSKTMTASSEANIPDSSAPTAEAHGTASGDQPPPAPKQKQRIHWDQLAQPRFTDLGITKDLYAQTGGARVRQHVNPLKRELQVPVGPLDWGQTYADPSLPLIVDIGSGYGRFLLALSIDMPDHNCLGLEIREPVIDRANRWAEALGLNSRVRFVLANATVSLDNMLASYPGSVDLVTVQFPDPHFKKRHRKRRIVQKQLVEAVAKLVRPGGRVLLQSDVLNMAEDMRDQFERAGKESFFLGEDHSGDPADVFYEASPPEEVPEGAEAKGVEEVEQSEWESTWAAKGWLVKNPVPVPTERELHVQAQGLPVYRVLLVRR